ncbi:MAG TPA: hypothetical protein VH186_06730 [Chloroflexia bacterium]|nr:hypothetical protein [Chloroflexia bacterium]
MGISGRSNACHLFINNAPDYLRGCHPFERPAMNAPGYFNESG